MNTNVFCLPAGRAARLCLVRDIGLPVVFAGVTGLLAGVRVPLPFTPVPLTGQVAGVLLAGLFLGPARAAFSQVFYLAAGLAGLPWFAGWAAVTPAGFGAYPAAGYLLAFAPAALLVAALLERGERTVARLFLAFGAGILVIHLGGALWLARLLGAGPLATLNLAVVPFIFFDFLKAALVASFAGTGVAARLGRADQI